MSIENTEMDDNVTVPIKVLLKLTPEAKSEIYRRYLKNLNYSRNGNESAHAYADLLLFRPENMTLLDADMELTTTSEYVPRDLPFTEVHHHIFMIILIIIYAIIFILGVLGNVVTCIVIAKNKSMHTAVNFYLFSLAVSDLLLLVTALPEEVYALWFPEYPFGEVVCKFHKFAAESFTNATVFCITAFTMERYVAICKPFLSHTLSKLSRACKLILGIWVLSIALAIPQTLFTLHIDEEYHICIPKTESQHYFAISTFLMFVIPMSVITILYILIGLQLRKSKIVQRGNINGSSVRLKRKIFNKKTTNQTLVTVNTESHYNEALLNNDINRNFAKNNFIDAENLSIPEDGRINYSTNRAQVHHGSKHIVKMLVVVVIAFAVCWSPFHLQRLLFSYIEASELNRDLSFCINYGSGVLFYISTCINPFLYNIMSNKFREAFKVTISKYFYGRQNEKDSFAGGRLFRTVSQRSNSMNSTSINTCSSICSMQPYSNQHQPFRYFDSKRPLVVSFRRVNKVTLPNNPPSSVDRCNSICDIHRIDLNRFSDGRKSMKTRFYHRFSAYGTSHSQSCRNFNAIDNRQKAHFDETPQRDKITITYPKEKFHGNAKLLFTINDDILRHNQQWYNSMNTASDLNNSTTSHRILHNRRAFYRQELIKNDNLRETKLKPAHKSTSTPSLLKLSNFPNALDFEEVERRRKFASILNVNAKETYLVRNTKSY